MIVLTGAAGFIGSCLLKQLNEEGIDNVILVDDFSDPKKNRNIIEKAYAETIHRNDFLEWFEHHAFSVNFVFHLGARTDTTEKDTHIFDVLNVNYSKSIWHICTQHQIPLVYASSAATYGLGERGFDDRHDIVKELKPLNPYGVSKNDFDNWALQQSETPPKWIGLKFFNVYGPNEYHKGRMASVIFHTVNQIKATGAMRLFRSHRPDFADGEQSRDFVYVKDVVKVCQFFYRKSSQNGLYNLGTGQARSFWDLATNTFLAMDLAPNISFIDTPEDIRDTYQYFTEANMDKLRAAGYQHHFYSLEEGVRDYVANYLVDEVVW